MKVDEVSDGQAGPQIYVIARSTICENEIQRFLVDEGQAWHRSSSRPVDSLVEFCGRICYMSFGESQSSRDNLAYIANLVSQGHESVLEHVSWTFVLTGISRAFTHQLVRHRPGWSYSQLSQQYHDESEARSVTPDELKAHPDLLRQWQGTVASAHETYRSLLDGLSRLPDDGQLSTRERLRRLRSAARSILPESTETKIVVTANARAIRYFLGIRGAIMGDVEMRQVSAKIYQIVSVDAPAMFADFSMEHAEDGLPLVKRRRSLASS